MKERQIKTEQERENAIMRIRKLPLPFVVGVAKEKTRSTAQNSRYWANLDFYLDKIQRSILVIADHTGYTPIEVRRLIAERLTPEQSALLYAVTQKAAHDVIKTICGVPTSTRLGTKQFMKFEEVMENTLTEAAGAVEFAVNEIMRKAS